MNIPQTKRVGFYEAHPHLLLLYDITFFLHCGQYLSLTNQFLVKFNRHLTFVVAGIDLFDTGQLILDGFEDHGAVGAFHVGDRVSSLLQNNLRQKTLDRRRWIVNQTMVFGLSSTVVFIGTQSHQYTCPSSR